MTYFNHKYDERMYGATSMTITPDCQYYATVLGIYEHFVLLSVLADQKTMRSAAWGDAKPYNWTVTKNDVGITEHFFEVADWDINI